MLPTSGILTALQLMALRILFEEFDGQFKIESTDAVRNFLPLGWVSNPVQPKTSLL